MSHSEPIVAWNKDEDTDVAKVVKRGAKDKPHASPVNSASNASGRVELKKEITLLHGVAIIIGIIIGSGIFVSPVGILRQVKSVGMSMVMWALCGVYNMLCALCYAELGTTIPESGGEYVYIKRSFGDFPAFLCLWINLLVVCPVGLAAASLIFATYVIKPAFPQCDPPMIGVRLIAAVIICLIIAVNCRNVKWATKLQVVISASKIIALAIIIVIGFIYIGKGELDSLTNTFEDTDYRPGPLAMSFYSGFWAYSGWSYLNFLTDELINPHRNLPLAILISMTIVITLYLITNVAYLGVLSPTQMLSSAAVAVTFGQETMGKAAFIMPILIALSVSGMMNGTSLTMSRLFWKGSQEKHFPSILSMITYNNFTPAPSLLLILVLTLGMQASNDIFFLIEMEGFGFATILTITLAGQVWLRYKQPDLKRPIKIPVVIPMAMSLLSGFIVVVTVYQQPNESLMSVVLILCGIPVYIVGVLWSKPPIIQEKISLATRIVQKFLLVVPAEDPAQLQFE